jgi:biopolymer transport protein ExbD
MKFKRSIREQAGLLQIDIVPFVNCLFLLLIFFMLIWSFITVPGMNVKFPRALTSQNINPGTLTLWVCDKEAIYIDGKAYTVKDLEGIIRAGKYTTVFIKSDKNTSLGFLAGIWGICKRLGIDKIGIATAYDE